MQHNAATHTASSSSEGKPKQQESAQYMPVLADGLRVNTVLDFDLFLRQDNNHYVLYRNKNLSFAPENAERLKTAEKSCLCISVKDREKYLGYVETQMEQIIADGNVPGERKTSLLYDSALNAITQMFPNPMTKAEIERCQAIVENIVTHLKNDSNALRLLFKAAPPHYTIETHSINVCAYSLAIATSMEDFSAEDLSVLGLGALLHDIGKYKINADTINKTTPLTPYEWDEIKRHPEFGLKILRNVKGVSAGALSIVALHHEKMNGSGYPAGLKGNEIPLMARIVCIADIFDALTSNRSYKGAVRSYEALVTMSDEMQSTIDNNVFTHFIELLQN